MTCLPARLLAMVAAAVMVAPSAARSAERPEYLAGYADDAAYAEQIETLKKQPNVAVRSLGESVGGRPIWAVTVGTGEPDTKPAIAVIGSAAGTHLMGSELVVRMAQRLASDSQNDDATAQLLERYTLYFVPRPDPDAAAKCFGQPLRTPQGNDRRTDDDRDFAVGEDPADDLNGDGIITTMRVEDVTGGYLPDTEDPRVLVAADRLKNEQGRYRVLVEGRDDDGDESFNEDGAGGVAIDHNFPHNYKSFESHAGEHAASEPETRALLDFLFDRPNVALVFSFSPDDNLYHPWKAGDGEKDRIRKTIQSADASSLELILGDYKKALDQKGSPPAPADVHGSFAEWAYFQYGRWSLAARGWWVPEVKEPADDAAKDANNEKDSSKKKSSDKRGSDDRNLLRWLAQEKIDGFVPWKEIEHRDFPGKKVEIGGFKPLVGLNPPAKQLDGLADEHLAFLRKLPDYFPQLEWTDVRADSLGGGIYRVRATVVNVGYLPTMPEMGRASGQNYPLQVQIELPENAELLQGTKRTRISPLTGNGGKSQRTWVVRFKDDPPSELELKAGAPAVGTVTAAVSLGE